MKTFVQFICLCAMAYLPYDVLIFATESKLEMSVDHCTVGLEDGSIAGLGARPFKIAIVKGTYEFAGATASVIAQEKLPHDDFCKKLAATDVWVSPLNPQNFRLAANRKNWTSSAALALLGVIGWWVFLSGSINFARSSRTEDQD